MALQCYLCGKRAMRGNLVSHSKQRTKRLFKPNLHSFRLKINGIAKKVRLCTTCIKTEKKRQKLEEERILAQKQKARELKKALEPKAEEKAVEHEKIPEEVRLEMKEKERKRKMKTQRAKDMDLVEEILSQSNLKEEKKK